MKKSRCANCGRKFESGVAKKKHKEEYPDASCKLLKGGEIKMFGRKKAKGKPAAPPVEEEIVVEEDEVSDEEVEEEEPEEEEEEEEEETPVIKKTKKKTKPPVEEELTEEKLKQVLINFETRLQKIEYNLRLAP